IEGETVVTKEPITLLGFVDTKTGTVTQHDHELNGVSIEGKIFVFPRGIGSTVGPYTLLNLMKNEKGPIAIINRESDQGTVAGCSVARIPMAYGFDMDPTEFMKTGDHIKLTIEKGKSKVELL
ncbi:MAG: aconitase X swivel domain-containing protein, partial [Candidatus Kariarchaeaceae archaeon]